MEVIEFVAFGCTQWFLRESNSVNMISLVYGSIGLYDVVLHVWFQKIYYLLCLSHSIVSPCVHPRFFENLLYYYVA